MSRKMRRGVQQSLYKYLPASWIDFSSKEDEGRENYIAKVDFWNSVRLEGINHRRLLRIIDRIVKSFGKTSGFPTDINESTCQVLTPKLSEQDRAIVASISPLTFVCSCGDTKIYNSANLYEKYGREKRCDKCGGERKQLTFIQFCVCGFAEPLKIFPCKQHGYDAIKRTDSRWNFICDKCKQPLMLRRKCDNCQSTDVWPPKVATDNSHFCPFTLSLIDLIDKGADEFIDNEKDFRGEKTIIAQYLGYITQDEFKDVLKKRKIVDGEGFENELKAKRKELEGLDEITIQLVLDNHRKNHGKSNVRNALTKIDQVFATFDEEKIRPTVEQIMEYDELITSPNQLSLEQAQQDVATISDGYAKDYRSVAGEFGFSNVRVCSNIPIVSAAYGYTRKEREGGLESPVVLHGLKAESAKKNVYAVKLETEGVLFEFDRAKILHWLKDNDFLSSEDMPRKWDEESLKTWFLERVNSAEVKSFTHIAEEHKETQLVYRLIHSITHILIKQAAEICGLDKDSLSEYIMPNIPAVFIYCQNAQGFNMGAMYNIFQMYFDKWLKGAKELSKKCIFDPMCINGSFDNSNTQQRACAGCLFLNETTCRHFNKDLERGFICGYIDRKNKKKVKGFWED